MSEKMIVACPDCRTRFVAPLEKFLPDGRKVRCAKCGHAWFQKPEVAPTESPPPQQPKSESIMDRAAQAAASASVIERADARRAEVEKEQATETIASEATTLTGDSPQPQATAVETPVAEAGEDLYGEAAPMPQTDPVAIPKPRRSFWPRAFLYTVAAAVIAGALGYFFKDQISAKVPALAPTLTKWHATVEGVVSKTVPAERSLRIENVKYDFEEIDGGKALLVSAEVVNDGNDPLAAPELSVTILDADRKILHQATIAEKDLREEISGRDTASYYMRLPLPPEDMAHVEVDFADKATSEE